MTLIKYYLALLICVLGVTTASADNLPSSEDQKPLWEFAVKGGTSIVLNGQSNALAHRIRYTIRAELAYQLIDRLQLGAEVILPATFEKNYRMIGVLVNAKVAVYEGTAYRLKIAGGFGLGTGPKILSTELDTSEPIRLWYHVVTQHRWVVVRKLLHIGLDLSFENLSVVSGNLVFQFHF